MRLALSQFGAALCDVAANRRRMIADVRLAADQGADLVCFPELALSGYVLCAAEYSRALLEAVQEAERDLARESSRLGVTVVYGAPRRDDDGRLRNAVIFVTPDGGRVVYDKTHMAQAERRLFTAGDALVVTEPGIGLACCYDLAFPELIRALAMQGARLLLVPMAWEVQRAFVMRDVLAARAVENIAFVAAVNQVGAVGGLRFAGGTCLVDPLGEQRPSAGDRDGLVLGDVDLGWVDRLRAGEDARSYPLLDDRRPDLYGPVAAPGTCSIGNDPVLSQTSPFRAPIPLIQ